MCGFRLGQAEWSMEGLQAGSQRLNGLERRRESCLTREMVVDMNNHRRVVVDGLVHPPSTYTLAPRR